MRRILNTIVHPSIEYPCRYCPVTAQFMLHHISERRHRSGSVRPVHRQEPLCEYHAKDARKKYQMSPMSPS